MKSKKATRAAAMSLAAACALAAASSCSKGEASQPRELTENEKYAIARGREAAAHVASLPSNTMEQEYALFEIRATEQKIRQVGDSAAADAYVRAAEQYLDSVGILTPRRK